MDKGNRNSPEYFNIYKEPFFIFTITFPIINNYTLNKYNSDLIRMQFNKN